MNKLYTDLQKGWGGGGGRHIAETTGQEPLYQSVAKF